MKGEKWLFEISPRRNVFGLSLKEVWRYRDLLMLFVKRDVITLYKQTILGPLWYLIQPLFTSLIFTLIFNNLAEIPTGDGIPNFLFNLSGVTAWGYFKECFMGTSDTFKKNENIFGKVYFPRIIMPLSLIVSNLVKFGIQLLIFVAFYIYFVFFTPLAENASPRLSLLLFPVLIILMGFLGLGFGMIISSMTTKYRDLTFLVQFGVQLLMYGSAVMYPISYFVEKVPKYSWLVEWNPIAVIIESFRNMSLNTGEIDVYKLAYAIMATGVVFLVGLFIFNRTEKNFIDTI